MLMVRVCHLYAPRYRKDEAIWGRGSREKKLILMYNYGPIKYNEIAT